MAKLNDFLRFVCLVTSATVVVACNLWPSLGSAGNPTKLTNSSGRALVIGVVESGDSNHRFYASPAGTTITIDTIADGNYPATRVTILDPTCVELAMLTDDFDDGGLITITGELALTFEAARPVGAGSEWDSRQDTCAQAADEL